MFIAKQKTGYWREVAEIRASRGQFKALARCTTQLKCEKSRNPPRTRV